MDDTRILDLRGFRSGERLSQALRLLGELPSGGVLELLDDRDPADLRRNLRAASPEEIRWEVLENGPESWRVRVARIAKPAFSSAACCRYCCD